MTRNRNFPICGIRQQQRRPVRSDHRHPIRHRGRLDHHQRTVLEEETVVASRKNKTGITVAGILGGLAIVLITIIVIIQTGVWATVAPQFGLPAITSISQILPGEDSMQKTNIGLGLKKPDLSKIEGQIKDGLASSGNTGERIPRTRIWERADCRLPRQAP